MFSPAHSAYTVSLTLIWSIDVVTNSTQNTPTRSVIIFAWGEPWYILKQHFLLPLYDKLMISLSHMDEYVPAHFNAKTWIDDHDTSYIHGPAAG